MTSMNPAGPTPTKLIEVDVLSCWVCSLIDVFLPPILLVPTEFEKTRYIPDVRCARWTGVSMHYQEQWQAWRLWSVLLAWRLLVLGKNDAKH